MLPACSPCPHSKAHTNGRISPQVVLAVLGACSAFPFIPDAPDVAAEKARFFQAYQAAHAANQPRSRPTHSFAPQPAAPQQSFVPQSFVPQQAFNLAPAPQPKWTGPLAATVPAGLPGSSPVLAETPEVAAAKNAFLNAYSAQIAATVPRIPSGPQQTFRPAPQQSFRPAPQQSFRPAPQQSFQPAFSAPAPPQPKWTGPLAATVPAGLPGSSAILSDTPEVSAAKNAFFRTYTAQVAATAGAPGGNFF